MAEDPSNTQKAIALAAGALPGILARIYGPDANSNVPPELRQLLAQQTQRSAYQNPLFEAVTGQALAGLPDYAKAGHTLGPSMGTSVPQVSGGGGGGMGPGGALAAGGLGALAGLLGKPGSGGNLPLQQLINALKKLFAKKDGTFTGPQQETGPSLDDLLQNPNLLNPDMFPGFMPTEPNPMRPDVNTNEFLDQWPESYGSGGTGGVGPDMFPGSSGDPV